MMRILWIQISKTALNTAVKLLLVHCFDDRFHNALSDPCSVQPMLDFRSIILVTLLLLVPASLTDPCSIYSMHDFRSIILVTLLLLVPASLSDPCSIDGGTPIGMIDDKTLEEVTLLEKVTYKIIRTDGIFKMISTFMLVKLYVMQRNVPRLLTFFHQLQMLIFP